VLVAAVTRGGSALGATAAIRGLEALGTSVESAAFMRLVYGPGQRDGIGAVRGVTFVQSCTCFRYTGPVVPV
jgi:hypothetical protein